MAGLKKVPQEIYVLRTDPKRTLYILVQQEDDHTKENIEQFIYDLSKLRKMIGMSGNLSLEYFKELFLPKIESQSLETYDTDTAKVKAWVLVMLFKSHLL